MAALDRSCKHPVLPADGDGPHLTLDAIVVDRDFAVVEEARQRTPLPQRVGAVDIKPPSPGDCVWMSDPCGSLDPHREIEP